MDETPAIKTLLELYNRRVDLKDAYPEVDHIGVW
jgi:hypothetical protein